MLKWMIKNTLLVLLVSLIGNETFAASGSLFKLTSTGTSGTPLSLSLCLNINGKSPISCQNYTTYSGILTLSTTVPNHTYHYAGIRINTPGYVFIPTTQGLNASINTADITVIFDSSATYASLPPLNNKPVAIGSVQLKIQRAVAVGNDLNGALTSFTSTNAGITWAESTTQPPLASGFGYLYGVACSSNGLLCTAVGSDGSALISYTSTNGGATWAASNTPPNGAGHLNAVACSSNGLLCTAVGVGYYEGVLISYTSTDGGVTWAESITQPQGLGYLSGVACSSSGLLCTAVGGTFHPNITGNEENLDVPIGYTSTDAGITWTASTTEPQGTGFLYGVACSSNGVLCTAVGWDGGGATIGFTSKDGGTTWAESTTQPQGLGYLSAVACSSNGVLCIAVGENNNGQPIGFTSKDGGATWAESTTQPQGLGYLSAVACSSNGVLCIAVGKNNTDQPIGFTSRDAGVTWTASTTEPQGTGELNAVAMASQ